MHGQAAERGMPSLFMFAVEPGAETGARAVAEGAGERVDVVASQTAGAVARTEAARPCGSAVDQSVERTPQLGAIDGRRKDGLQPRVQLEQPHEERLCEGAARGEQLRESALDELGLAGRQAAGRHRRR